MRNYEEVAQDCAEGVAAYLAGMLQGVGPKTAEAIVATLGTDVVQLLGSRDAVLHLQKVPGIKRKRASDIKSQWDKRAGVMALCAQHVISMLTDNTPKMRVRAMACAAV